MILECCKIGSEIDVIQIIQRTVWTVKPRVLGAVFDIANSWSEFLKGMNVWVYIKELGFLPGSIGVWTSEVTFWNN